MSLKVFHITFITLASALGVVFGVWNMQRNHIVTAVAIFIIALALVAYGVSFLRSTKSLKLKRNGEDS